MKGQYWITEEKFCCEGQSYLGYGIGYRVVDELGNCYVGGIGDVSTHRSEVEALLLRLGEEPLHPETLQAVVEDYLAELTSVFLA